MLTISWEFPLLAWATGKLHNSCGTVRKHYLYKTWETTSPDAGQCMYLALLRWFSESENDKEMKKLLSYDVTWETKQLNEPEFIDTLRQVMITGLHQELTRFTTQTCGSIRWWISQLFNIIAPPPLRKLSSPLRTLEQVRDETILPLQWHQN